MEDTLEMERVSWKEKGMNDSLLCKLMIKSFASKIHTPLKCTFCGTCQPSSQSALFLFYTVLLYD